MNPDRYENAVEITDPAVQAEVAKIKLEKRSSKVVDASGHAAVEAAGSVLDIIAMDAMLDAVGGFFGGLGEVLGEVLSG